MSRIDKALEKAGLVDPQPPAESTPESTPSPWQFGDIDPEPIPDAFAVGEDTGQVDDERDDFPGLPDALHISYEDKLLATSSGMENRSIEQFRRLAAALHLMQGRQQLKTVLVASALPSEGKTLTSCNLALCLSGSYHRRVLLIDADLRRPTVRGLFKIPGTTGLNEWLRSDSHSPPAVERVSRNLSVLPAGRPDPDPMGILTSERMSALLDRASTQVDWVVIDSPPIGLISDAHLLAAMADAVVLVVRAAKTPYAEIQRAIEAIGRDRVAGVVLNRVEGAVGGPYDYYSGPRGTEGNVPFWKRFRSRGSAYYR